MTTITDIEALGVELPKGRRLLRFLTYYPGGSRDAYTTTALAEAYAVIERLTAVHNREKP